MFPPGQTPVLIPAYGRDYKTVHEAQGAFAAGKDWMLAATGQYCSRSDFADGSKVQLRYAGKRRVTVVTVGGQE